MSTLARSGDGRPRHRRTAGRARSLRRRCFLSQQAAEKAMKGLLYHEGADTVSGHSVAALCQDVRTRYPELTDPCARWAALDQHYMPTRYPDALPGGHPPTSTRWNRPRPPPRRLVRCSTRCRCVPDSKPGCWPERTDRLREVPVRRWSASLSPRRGERTPPAPDPPGPRVRCATPSRRGSSDRPSRSGSPWIESL